MPEQVKVNVVSYGGVKPGQVVVGNGADGERTSLFDPATDDNSPYLYYMRKGLTSFSAAMPALTDGSYMFTNCSSLTSFSAAMPELNKAEHMFQECRGLTEWTVDLPKLTSAYGMFDNCRGLTKWTGDLRNLKGGSYMFYVCTHLKTFEVGLPALEGGAAMFDGCVLDAGSVKSILQSIPNRAEAGLGIAVLHLGSKQNFYTDVDVSALLRTADMQEVGTPIPAGSSYKCVDANGNDKGWKITITN